MDDNEGASQMCESNGLTEVNSPIQQRTPNQFYDVLPLKRQGFTFSGSLNRSENLPSLDGRLSGRSSSAFASAQQTWEAKQVQKLS